MMTVTASEDEYSVGKLVELIPKPEWGPGRIMHVDGDKLYVVFRDLGGDEAKVYKRNAHALRLASFQNDPVLNELPPLVKRNGEWYVPALRMSLEVAQRRFLLIFPEGFEDPAYLKQERDYKDKANSLFQDRLGGGEGEKLVAAGDVATLVTQGRAVLNGVNLWSPFESAAFNDAMQDEGAVLGFYAALFRLLGTNPLEAGAFDVYTAALESLPAERGPVVTWPVATILPHIASPSRFMFLKPIASRKAAETLGFDLRYEPKPNWTTYSALLRMGSLYLNLLASMGAKDFVDVQSFFFVIAGGYDKAKGLE